MNKQIPEKYKGTMYARGYEEDFSLFDSKDDEVKDDFKELNEAGPHRFYGKYRGTVLTNVDPLRQGRLQLDCPGVKALLPVTWALPCLPFTGTGMGAYVVPPPVGTGVWIEFEGGNPDKPVWVGCYYATPVSGAPAVPGLLANAACTFPAQMPLPAFIVETGAAGIGVTTVPVPLTNPVPGAVTLYAGGASITLSPTMVSIAAPQVSILTPLFTVNGAKLVVT